ncbi:MAG: hypothetical protein ACRD8O_21825 [Bryobacteraceae bacterium]
MAIEAIQLDDLQWQSMTTAIRGRIVQASDGQWTLHAPVDPGVTLVELYAWLLEQRVFWMDQAPDSLVRASMALLGESPLPVEIAGAVLSLSAASGPTVPALTQMRRNRPGSGVVFTTAHAVARLAIARIDLFVAGHNRTEDLHFARKPELFADGGEVRLVFWLTQPPVAPPAGEPLALLVELDVPDRKTFDPEAPALPPEWSPRAVANVPPPADLEWLYPSTAGGLASVPAAAIKDGTAGLRRSGVVRLPMPANWAPDGPPDPVTLATPYSLVVRASTATYSSPPRLVALEANVALASHRRLTKEHEIPAGGWLPIPGNRVILSDLRTRKSEVDHPPIEESVKIRILERTNGWQDWQPVRDLSFYGPADRVFTVDREKGVVQFGDGLTGRLPVIDAAAPDPRVIVQFEVGGGQAGNLGRNLDWRGADDETIRARNLVDAVGGDETESIAEARARMGAALRRVERAITRADHETVAVTTEGIAIVRAHAAAGVHPCFPCDVVPGAMTVYVVPAVPRPARNEDDEEFTYVAAPQPDEGALRLLRERFAKARLLASEVFVFGPRYRAVSLRIELDADPLDPRELRGMLWRRMRRYLDPLTGGDDGNGWPFGEPLRPSVLRREAQRGVGTQGEVSTVAIGLDGAPATESCSDVSIGAHELVYLDQIDVRLRRLPSAQGGLR